MPNRVILVVVAHPDDAELTCAASIARWVKEGDVAVLAVATDGSRGGKFPESDARAMATTRAEEQRMAAATIGFSDVVTLQFEDGSLSDDEDLRSTLVEQIRRIRPDVVVTMDPLTVIYRNSYVNHRDHRMLGMALLDALYPEASNAGYYPAQIAAGLQPHKVPELLLVQSEVPNYWVDVSETLEVRFEALRCHQSQVRLWPENGETVIRQQREYAASLGVEHGMRYAEAFRRVVVNPLA